MYANNVRLNRLDTEERVFTSADSGVLCGTASANRMLDNLMAPKLLTLRINAQVMLIRNINEDLVNGTIGKVVEFADHSTFNSGQGHQSTECGNGVVGDTQSTVTTPVHIFPVVDFVGLNGHRRVLVTPENWQVEGLNGIVLISRTQVRTLIMLLYYVLIRTLGALNFGLGHEYTQSTGSNHPARKGRFKKDI
jgi:ATP-dependent DNA helicase PIF1